MSKFPLIFLVFFVAFFVFGEAKSVDASGGGYNSLSEIKHDLIDAAANTIVSFFDRNLGRQARSVARTLFGIQNEEAMKVTKT
jgi:hypothetical protein